MKRAVWITTLAMALTANAAPSGSPESVLERMRARQNSLTTLEARIEQRKSHPQLGIEDPPERGSFRLRRGRGGKTSVRIEIDVPEPRVLIVSGGRYQLYQPRLRQAIEGELAGRGAKGLFSGLLSGAPEASRELERDYVGEGAHLVDAGGRPAHELRFTALAGASAYCREVVLLVDAELLVPVRQTCREANESVITFSLTDVKLGVELDPKLFDFDRLPPGVERVKG